MNFKLFFTTISMFQSLIGSEKKLDTTAVNMNEILRGMKGYITLY